MSIGAMTITRDIIRKAMDRLIAEEEPVVVLDKKEWKRLQEEAKEITGLDYVPDLDDYTDGSLRVYGAKIYVDRSR